MKKTRRDFLKTTAVAVPAFAFGWNRKDTFKKGSGYRISGFTKELQFLSYDATAEAVLKMGWDGIECPVRPGGHVLPERVEEDLPKMVEALKKRGLTLDIMATSIHNTSEEYTENVLRTAAGLGIRYYRMGWWNYDLEKPIQGQLDDIRAQMKELAALNQELRITGVYQNHSGTDSVGAPVWDIYGLLSEINSAYLGCHFDIGHATVEGGYAWRINYERMKNVIRAVIVKDFQWNYTENRFGRVAWCPLGEGMIRPGFFDLLKQSEFSGPVTLHFEYPVQGEGDARIDNLMTAMKKDAQTLRKWLD